MYTFSDRDRVKISLTRYFVTAAFLTRVPRPGIGSLRCSTKPSTPPVCPGVTHETIPAKEPASCAFAQEKEQSFKPCRQLFFGVDQDLVETFNASIPVAGGSSPRESPTIWTASSPSSETPLFEPIVPRRRTRNYSCKGTSKLRIRARTRTIFQTLQTIILRCRSRPRRNFQCINSSRRRKFPEGVADDLDCKFSQ
jgi:hypothetical protein